MLQENMFDLIDTGFCFDNDINEIVRMLDEIFSEYKMITEIKKNWRVWSHVPNLGYRLSYHIYFNSHLPEKIFEEIQEVVEYAKGKNVEIEPFGYMFFDYDNSGSMSIYSIYSDSRIKLNE